LAIISKDYKNVKEVMKSNSKVEQLMKKFSYYKKETNLQKSTIIFDDLLENFNADFYLKCENIVESLKSFLDIFTALLENSIFEPIDDLDKIIAKIKIYFSKIEENSQKSREAYINYLFEAIDVKNFQLPKDEMINQEINETNELIMFAFFQVSQLDYIRNTTSPIKGSLFQ
jgi:hypothetical protein